MLQRVQSQCFWKLFVAKKNKHFKSTSINYTKTCNQINEINNNEWNAFVVDAVYIIFLNLNQNEK